MRIPRIFNEATVKIYPIKPCYIYPLSAWVLREDKKRSNQCRNSTKFDALYCFWFCLFNLKFFVLFDIKLHWWSCAFIDSLKLPKTVASACRKSNFRQAVKLPRNVQDDLFFVPKAYMGTLRAKKVKPKQKHYKVRHFVMFLDYFV